MISLNKLAVIAASFGAVSMASASIIDFEGMSSTFTNPIDAQGFRFAFDAGGWGVIKNTTTLGHSLVRNGTVRLIATGAVNGHNALVAFKPLDDSAFSLQQFDAATLLTGTQGGIDVIGTLEGGGTVTASFSTVDAFATYVLPTSFVNLDSVTVMNQIPGASWTDSGFNIDNVVVNAAPVPEPATLSALGLALAAFAKRRRKS